MTLPYSTIVSWGDDLTKTQDRLRRRAKQAAEVPGNGSLHQDLNAAANALAPVIRTLTHLASKDATA